MKIFHESSRCKSWIDNRFNPEFAAAVKEARWPGADAVVGGTKAIPCEHLALSARAIPYWMAGSPDDFIAPPCLIWIHDYSIWESSELLGMFFRWACGAADETIDRVPAGLEFDRGDLLRVAEPLFMALCFGWDVTVVMEGCRTAIHLNHHSMIWATTDSPEAESAARSFVESYKYNETR
jgi:hypothetical protein